MFYWTYYIHFTSTVTLFSSCFHVLLDILLSLYQHCYTVQFMFLCFTGHITFTLPALLHCSIHVFMFYWTYYIHFTSTVTLFNSCFYVLLDILNSLYQHCYTVQFMCSCFTGHITFTLPALLHCSIHVFMFYWTYYFHFTSTVTLFNSCFHVLLDILHSLYQHYYTVQFMFLCFTGHITFILPVLLHCSIHVCMLYWTYYIHFTSTVTLFNSCFYVLLDILLSLYQHCYIVQFMFFMFYWTYYIHFTSTVKLFNSCFFMYYWTLYVIQLSDRVYNVTFPAEDLYSLRRSRREYIS
jgi:hypothetical protein